MRYAVLILFIFISCQDRKEDVVVIDENDNSRDRGAPPAEEVNNFPGPDGFPPVERNPQFLRFDNIEHFALNSLQDQSVDAAERVNSRFLILSDKFNEGASPEQMAVYRAAVNKALNSLSLERDIEIPDGIDSADTILRVDFRDYGLTAKKWQAIQDAEQFDIISRTSRGSLLRNLTQAKQPFMHANVFVETAMLGSVYYEILETPLTLAGFYSDRGVDLQDLFDDFDEDLFMVGISNSEIAIQKTRLFLRADSRFGTMWSTYDTVLGNNNNSVVFENPFPIEARSQKIFNHQAQEFIYTLENGCHGYALFAGVNGDRENFAPTNIVFDPNSGGLSPQIDNARSCTKCHSQGFIVAEDQVFDKVQIDPDFNGNDRERARRFFGPKADVAAAFQDDNARYASRCLAAVGTSAGEPDPLNRLTNTLRQEWDLQQTAAFFFLPVDEFSRGLRASRAFAQIGQLLEGDSVNKDDIIRARPQLEEDLNLFRDPLGQ